MPGADSGREKKINTDQIVTRKMFYIQIEIELKVAQNHGRRSLVDMIQIYAEAQQR